MQKVNDATFQKVVLFLLGGALQVTLVYVLAENVFSTSTAIQKLSQHDTIILALAIFMIGVVYCIGATFSFHPKRFFSPILLQLSAWSYLSVLILVILLYGFMDTQTPSSLLSLYTILVNWAANSGLMAIFLSIFGVGQFFVVRFITGRNGMESDIEVRGYVVPLKLSTVTDTIDDASEHPIAGSYRHIERNTHHLFRLARGRDLDNQSLMVVRASLKNQNVTELAIANFDLYWTQIVKNDYSREIIDTKIRAFQKLLGRKLSPIKDSKATILSIARKEALAPTRPRSIRWAGITRGAIPLLLGLAAAVVVMWLMQYWNIISLEILETFLVFASIDFIFAGIPAIVDTIRQRSTK